MQKNSIPILITTRVFDKMTQDDLEQKIKPFLEKASPLDKIVVVSTKDYMLHEQLEAHVRKYNKHNNITIVDSVSSTPTDMCNTVVHYCQKKGFEYFAIISNDLTKDIPTRLPAMFDLLLRQADLAAIGLAIKGVHDTELLENIKYKKAKVTVDNFANIFYNNAFSVNRLKPIINGRKFNSNRIFPKEIDQEDFGTADREGKPVTLGGNEEIALIIKLLKQGVNMPTLLLAGDYTIVRDRNQETSSVDKKDKVWRRSPTAKAYQKHFGVSDEMLQKYLESSYEIKFH